MTKTAFSPSIPTALLCFAAVLTAGCGSHSGPRDLMMEEAMRHHLSLIEPQSWHQKWIGSFRLNADGRWQADKIADDFDLRGWIGAAA